MTPSMQRILFALAIGTLTSATAQQPVWQRMFPVKAGEAQMVHDSARDRTVLVCWEDTFEWQGDRWAHRANTAALPAQQIAMAFDAQRQVTTLFGGRENLYADATWEYDGRAWQQQQAAVRPAPRTTRMAHDPVRGRTVLFSGASNAGWFDDTWEWDGTQWSVAAPAAHPAARIVHGMAYDVVRRAVLLFGGASAAGDLGDTWSWDGVNWVQLTPAIAPPARSGHAMAADWNRGRVVLFGGRSNATLAEFDDTWEWDGTDWTQIQPVIRPSPRSQSSMAAARQPGGLLLFGGYGGESVFADTWSWDGTTWRKLGDGLQPGAVGAIVADHVRGHLLSFGAPRGSPATPSNETWIGNGVDWTLRPTGLSPSARWTSMACDEARQEIVLFGGRINAPLSDTWVWDGNGWTQRLPPQSPPAGLYRMVYDPVRQVVLLCDVPATGLIDVWQWNGVTWSLRPAATRPPPRWGSAMEYDVANQRLVLFGGYQAVCGALCTNVVNFADTWLWDGFTWTQASTAIRPTGRTGATMLYDRVRQRTYLLGGLSVFSLGEYLGFWPIADWWEWDGAGWTGPRTLPSHGGQSVFDPGLRRPMLLDSQALTLTDAANGVQTYGVGCAGSRGMPWLASNPPTLGNRSFAVDAGALPPLAPCLFGLASGQGSTLVAPGCNLVLGGPLAIHGAVANNAGFASVPVAIPAAPGLRGQVVHAQALALDGATAVGLSMTAGLRLMLGD